VSHWLSNGSVKSEKNDQMSAHIQFSVSVGSFRCPCRLDDKINILSLIQFFSGVDDVLEPAT
jgi:hypothetical protein